jgi:hypothetical protein
MFLDSSHSMQSRSWRGLPTGRAARPCTVAGAAKAPLLAPRGTNRGRRGALPGRNFPEEPQNARPRKTSELAAEVARARGLLERQAESRRLARQSEQ